MSASRKRPSELLDITAEDGPTEQIEASEENDEKPFKRVDIKDSIDSKDSVPPASVPCEFVLLPFVLPSINHIISI